MARHPRSQQPNSKGSAPVRCPCCREVKCYVASVKGLEPRAYALRPCVQCVRTISMDERSKLRERAKPWLAPLPKEKK